MVKTSDRFLREAVKFPSLEILRIQRKSWTIWSNFEISLVLGKEWGSLNQMASKGPFCPKLTYDHPVPNLQVSGAGGAF